MITQEKRKSQEEDEGKEFRRRLKKFEDSELDEWEICCRKMQVCIIREMPQLAQRTLAEYIRVLNTPTEPITHESYVQEVVPVRLANALENAGYITVGSVVKATDAELSSIENLGMVGIVQIRKSIQDALSNKPRKRDYSEVDESLAITPAKEQEPMTQTTTDPVEALLNVMTNAPERMADKVNERVAELEAQLAQLKQLQKMLGCKVKQTRQPKQSKTEAEPRRSLTMSMTGDQAKAEGIVVNLLNDRGTLSCKEIASELTNHGIEYLPVHVGRLVAVSEKLTKAVDGRVMLSA